ncbi:MAG: hypothetical protein V7K53_23205 [Nostoc sp.]|uniref:hypothetical protein n=1 Tax=Nostoc sp. TaxID=1180 RepID=UPI002FFB1111
MEKDVAMLCVYKGSFLQKRYRTLLFFSDSYARRRGASRREGIAKLFGLLNIALIRLMV